MSLRDHLDNACEELPKEVLLLAQEYARDIPSGEWTVYHRLTAEAHPAITVITQWWNVRHPEQKAGSYLPLRFSIEDNGYQPLTKRPNQPPIPPTTLRAIKDSALVYQETLLVMMRPMRDFRPSSEGLTLAVATNGKVVHGIGCHPEQLACFQKNGGAGPWYDYAWIQLNQLKSLDI